MLLPAEENLRLYQIFRGDICRLSRYATQNGKRYALLHVRELEPVERATAMITNARHDPSYIVE